MFSSVFKSLVLINSTAKTGKYFSYKENNKQYFNLITLNKNLY